MERDFDRDVDCEVRKTGGGSPALPGRELERPVPSREQELFQLRGSFYRLSESDLDTMRDIGRFRTVALEDLARYRYVKREKVFKDALRALLSQGLVQTRAAWAGPGVKPLEVAVLTKLGKELLEQRTPLRDSGHESKTRQALYSGFVKPNEVRHDAAIYRMYQAERERIERAGGHIRRIILDYELKKKVYAPLAKAKTLPAVDYAKRQQQVALENGLVVIRGKIPLPDLRLEYETRTGESTRIDLELATGHYHAPALSAKAAAGFKFYAADGSGSRLSRVLEERDITVAILTL
jgi:hypothetical protein